MIASKKISRYFLKAWLKTFTGASFTLFLLVAVGMIAAGLMQKTTTPSDVLYNFLINIPTSLGQIFPVACLVASMFSVDKFRTQNELVAFFASGYRPKEFYYLIFGASVFVALFLFISLAFLQPFAYSKRHQLIDNIDQKFSLSSSQGLKYKTLKLGRTWFRGRDYFLSFVVYDKAVQGIRQAKYLKLDERGFISYTLESPLIQYSSEFDSWKVVKGKLIDSTESREEFSKLSSVHNFFVPLELKPQDLNEIEADVTTLDILDLYSYIKGLKQSGINTNEYQVLFYSKFTGPLICIIFALIALSSIFNLQRRGYSPVKNITVIIIGSIVYWLLYSYSLEMGKKGSLDPLLGAFSTPLLFLLILVILTAQQKRLK